MTALIIQRENAGGKLILADPHAVGHPGTTQIRLPKNCEIGDGVFDGCGKVYVFAPAGGTTESWCQGKDNIVFVGMDN